MALWCWFELRHVQAWRPQSARRGEVVREGPEETEEEEEEEEQKHHEDGKAIRAVRTEEVGAHAPKEKNTNDGQHQGGSSISAAEVVEAKVMVEETEGDTEVAADTEEIVG